jgi:plastocyanin
MARLLIIPLAALAFASVAVLGVAQEDVVQVLVGTPVTWSVDGTPVRILNVVAMAGEDGDYEYAPDDIRVPVGTEVIWKNQSDDVHTVTSEDGGPLDSGGFDDPVEEGEEYAHVFDTPGEFNYFCEFHPMEGTVRVE